MRGRMARGPTHATIIVERRPRAVICPLLPGSVGFGRAARPPGDELLWTQGRGFRIPIGRRDEPWTSHECHRVTVWLAPHAS